MAIAMPRLVNVNVLISEARRQGFDDVLHDPTDDEIILAVCEMLNHPYWAVNASQRERMLLAYDRAQAQLDPIKRQVWA